MNKKLTFLPVGILLMTASCTEDNQEKIIGRWQQESIHNPVMEQVIEEQQSFIDTIGRNTTAEQNDSLYGTRNVDSLREMLKEEISNFKKDQEEAIKNTWFEFRKDGVLVLKTDDMVDSSSWYLEDEGHTLVLDEQKLKGSGSQVRMEIMMLDKDAMKLRFNQGQDTSTVTFKATTKQ